MSHLLLRTMLIMQVRRSHKQQNHKKGRNKGNEIKITPLIAKFS